jgi:hypothetical protein
VTLVFMAGLICLVSFFMGYYVRGRRLRSAKLSIAPLTAAIRTASELNGDATADQIIEQARNVVTARDKLRNRLLGTR